MTGGTLTPDLADDAANEMADDVAGDVAVAVISYNTCDILRDCLTSVMLEAPTTVVVVDNGSTDGSIEMIRREFPAVHLVTDATNPGYGAAANRAVTECARPYILLLNSDTMLHPGSIAALRDYMEQHHDAGVVGPRLVNPDGSLQPSCFAFPSAAFLFVEHSPFRAAARLLPRMRRHFFIGWPHTEARAVPWVVGAALLMRREAFDAVGGFDASFHMYYEEVDLAYRMEAAGWTTHFAPVADVTHLGGATTARTWSAMRVRYFRSLSRFCAMHSSRGAATRLALALHVVSAGKLVLDEVRRPFARDAERRRDLEARVALWRELVRVPFLREAREVRANRSRHVRTGVAYIGAPAVAEAPADARADARAEAGAEAGARANGR